MSLSDEQRAGLALVLMVLILMLWSQFYKPPEKPPQPNPPTATNVQQPPAAVSPGPSPEMQAKAKATLEAQGAAPTVAVKQAKTEETITVESGLYHVELSNRGAVAKSWRMNRYENGQTPPKPLELVHADAANQLHAWPLSVRLGDAGLDAAANSGLYVVNAKGTTLRAPAEIELDWSDGHLEVSKKLKFGTDYETGIEVSAKLDGKPLPVGLAWRGGFGDESVYNAAFSVQVFYSTGGKLNVVTYKKLGEKDHPDQPAIATGNAEFGGVEDLFFTAAFLPEEPGLAIWSRTEEQNVTADGKTSQAPVVEMAAGTETPGPFQTRLYVGPKDLTGLGKLKPSLAELVQFGYVGFIAKPLLWTLKWFYKYVPNYGWDIVLLTLVLNMLLYPLKVKSWHSSKKMQAMMPKQKAIQEKYKKYSLRDPRRQQMQTEISELYKEYGVNPLSSCLPQLVQLPIWWSLYRMLEFSIELRHAPWFAWIHDLTAYDPYYVIPILMSLAGYYMTKMTPTPVADPAQQKMMAIMPLAMGLLFIRFSAGLNLYILTSYVVGIAQQYFLMKSQPLPSRSPFKNKPAKA